MNKGWRAALTLSTIGPVLFLVPGQSVDAQAPEPNPRLLPVATTSQVPLTAEYDALDVPSIAAGGSYLDPTTGVQIYKLTSATYPTPDSACWPPDPNRRPVWGHDYTEGGNEVSLPYHGNTRAVVVRQEGGCGGPWWLVDFTAGVGVSNPRQLTGNLAPWSDLAFTFSVDPSTPYYAYVANFGGAIRRIDIRTMIEAPGDGWPITDAGPNPFEYPTWLHQSRGAFRLDDDLFVWMRGSSGDTVVGYQPRTRTLKLRTDPELNEPRIDRAGRYVGLAVCAVGSVCGISVWDWLTDSIPWEQRSGDYPNIPFTHNASLRRRWVDVDTGLTWPGEFARFIPDVPDSGSHLGGPANATLVHGSGNWIQYPGNLDSQWALFTHYGSLQPCPPDCSDWLAPGGMVFTTARPKGPRHLLGHPYNTSGVYNYFTFAKLASDGRYVLFTSDMNGSGRSDVFLAEVPTRP